MRLKKLYIHGFKSFADRVEMTFEQGVTGVVGPNGCGKSNISDAVRWVLGEQSAKQLRGAKMEDVIFNGTEKRRRMAYCEVTLTFDNEDHALSSDYTEVAVTRRVFRTGESEYQLNGTPCRLKDIIDLFRDTGIGRDGYSIIGQGRIDEILSQRSEDRRLVFEEAAGIVKYKTRRNEAEKRLNNTRDNLTRVTDILSELESRIEPLREQSEQARAYLKLSDEKKTLELNVFLQRTERGQARITDVTETTESLKTTLDANEREQTALSEKRDKSQRALTAREDEAALAREALQGFIREVEAKEGELGVFRERIQSLSREHDRLCQELEAAKDGEGGIETRIALLADKIAEETAQASAREEELRAWEAALSDGEREEATLESESEDAKERMIRSMNSLGDVRSEQARLTGLLGMIDQQVESLSGGEKQDSVKTEALSRALEDAQRVYTDEIERKETLEAEAKEVAERTRTASDTYERLARESTEILTKKRELATRLDMLKVLQRDYEGYTQSVKQVLMEASRRGGAGVRGVVASVVRVPKEFERAIDMVLGGALQNVVVDRDEDAKEMIEYLKRNRFGRATFLPISSIRGRTLDASERRILNMPGCVGVASEMVDFDPIYKGVIESLLGRTIIAKDLDSGIAIQRAGRYQLRLVTLDGDVMHAGGSMTGGSVQSRISSLLSREREIDECSAEMLKRNTEYMEAQKSMKESEEIRVACKKERAELFEALHQQEIACARGEAHLAQAKSDMEGHLARSSRVTEERARLIEQRAQVEESLARLQDEKESQEGEGDDIRKRAMETQAALNALRARLNGERTKVNDARVSLATLKRGLEAMTQDHQRLTRQRGDTERLRVETEAALSENAVKLESDARALEAGQTALTALKGSLNASRAAFQEADAARLSEQEALKKVNERAEALRVETEELTDRHHRAELLLARLEAELKQLTDRIWEDYQLSYEGAEPYRVENFNLTESEKRLAVVKNDIRKMGSVNIAAMDEYRQTTERFEEMSAQKADLDKAQADLVGIIDELTSKMEKMFRAQFEQLDVYFRQTFAELFGGGQAELRLEDPKDALNSGIEIVAQPPGKKLQMLSLLSGGERALTAIAILFAMLKLKPTPFCFLDEIEAALDDANIDNFADYLKTYSVKTQFVVVTHRKGTMSRCDALYGVAMEEKGISKMMSVKLADAV